MNNSATAQSQLATALEAWPDQVDPAWQERMVLQYAPLIKYIASRLALRLPAHISLEDLISSGIIGLIDAIHKFDPSKNISFKTYAEFRIKGAILDELRSLDWIPRSIRKKSSHIERACGELERALGRPPESEEIAAAMGLEMEEFFHLLDETKAVSLVELEGVGKALRPGAELSGGHLSEILADENARDPFLALHFSELQDLLVQAIDALPDKEKLLVSLYYYEELTMNEIGEIMGFTESRISQLHTQAMLRLRSKLRDYFPREGRGPPVLRTDAQAPALGKH